MNTRPDFTLRLEVLANRLKYLVEQKQEIDRQIALYTDEHDKLKDLQSLYKANPDDPIDIERAVPLPSELKKLEPSNRMCGRKIKSPLRDSIVAAIEDFGPLNSMELVETIKGHTPNSIRNTIMRMARDGALKRPDRKGGSYRLP